MTDFTLQPYLICQDEQSLEQAIVSEAIPFSEWADSEFSNLQTYKMSLRELVQGKSRLLYNLDYSKTSNCAFVIQLFDVCCTLPLTGAANILHNIIKEHKLVLGKRLEASVMVLRSYGSNEEFVEDMIPLCEMLNEAIQNEEDDNWPSIVVFLRYYARLVRDIQDEALVSYARNRIEDARAQYPFLNSPAIERALSIRVGMSAYDDIMQITSEQVGSTDRTQPNTSTPSSPQDGYDSRLASCAKSVSAIRSLAFSMVEELVEDSDAVYNSLGRGIRVLTNTDQLLVYMRAYGAMHEAKLVSAFEHFPFNELPSTINVVDWGCGQGIASMVLIEYLQSHQIPVKVSKCTLIEPSEVAIQRAEKHIHHFDPNVQIRKINRGFDSIESSDLNGLSEPVTLHLFSNILDYEGYDLVHLQRVVAQSGTEKNYYICVSPYINDVKRDRVFSFERLFDNKHHIYDIVNTAGTWDSNWTRIVNIFSVGQFTSKSTHTSAPTWTSSPDVFISYSQKDYKDAQGREIPGNMITQIQQALTNAGISYWIDREGLQGGDTFPQRIAQQIHEAKVFLFVSSANSNQSPWTMNEIATASAYEKPIIPFRLDDTQYAPSIMFYLAALQYVRHTDNPNSLMQLVDAIRTAMR